MLKTKRGSLLIYDDGNKKAIYKIMGQGRFSGIYRIEDQTTKELSTIILKFAGGSYNQFVKNFGG